MRASAYFFQLARISIPTGQTLTLSQQGFRSDANLDMGSTTFGTDQTAMVESLLASLDPNVTTTILNDCKMGSDRMVLRSNVTWINSDGCGLIQHPDVPEPFAQNKNPIGGRGSLTGVASFDRNITMRGGIINAAGYDTQGNVLRPINGSRAWPGAYSFMGVLNLTLDGTEFRNGRSIIGRVGNYSNVSVTNCRFIQSPTIPDNLLRMDGPKFLGPGTNCLLENAYIDQRSDDLFSICSTDVWYPETGHYEFGGPILDYDTAAGYGPIDGFTARNITAVRGKASYHGIRLMSSGQKISNVLIDNVHGDVGEYLAVLDNYNPNILYHAPTGSELALFGTVEFRNCNYNLVQGRSPAVQYPYYVGQASSDSAHVGAGIFVQANVDELRLVSHTQTGGYSADYPLLVLDSKGSITSLYGNDVLVAGASSPADAFVFRGQLGATSGNLFGATPGQGGITRLPVSTVTFVPAVNSPTFYFDFVHLNQVLYLTAGTGTNVTNANLANGVDGTAGQLQLVNTDTVDHVFTIPSGNNTVISSNSNNTSAVTVPANGGRIDIQIDYHTGGNNWWVTYLPTSALGPLAAPVPSGWTGAIAPSFVYNELVNPTYRTISGNDATIVDGDYDSGKLIYLPPGSATVIGYRGFAKGFKLHGQTKNDQYKGKIHLFVAIDGSAPVEVLPQPTQRQSNPSGVDNQSWDWYSYPGDGNWHRYELSFSTDASETTAYMTDDGVRWISY